MVLASGVSKLGELRALARALDERGLCYSLLINSSVLPRLNVDESLMRLGFKHGLPDIIIFDYPAENHRGMAIYMVGSKRMGSGLTEAQKFWVQALTGRKWMVRTATSAQEAVDFIQDAGL